MVAAGAGVVAESRGGVGVGVVGQPGAACAAGAIVADRAGLWQPEAPQPDISKAGSTEDYLDYLGK